MHQKDWRLQRICQGAGAGAVRADGAEPTRGLWKGQLKSSTWGPTETTQINLFWTDVPEPADGPNPRQGVISIFNLRAYTVQHISHGQRQCWQWNAAGKCAFEAVPVQCEPLRESSHQQHCWLEVGRPTCKIWYLRALVEQVIQLLWATLLPNLRNLGVFGSKYILQDQAFGCTGCFDIFY